MTRKAGMPLGNTAGPLRWQTEMARRIFEHDATAEEG